MSTCGLDLVYKMAMNAYLSGMMIFWKALDEAKLIRLLSSAMFYEASLLIFWIIVTQDNWNH